MVPAFPSQLHREPGTLARLLSFSVIFPQFRKMVALSTGTCLRWAKCVIPSKLSADCDRMIFCSLHEKPRKLPLFTVAFSMLCNQEVQLSLPRNSPLQSFPARIALLPLVPITTTYKHPLTCNSKWTLTKKNRFRSIQVALLLQLVNVSRFLLTTPQCKEQLQNLLKLTKHG